MQIIVDRFKKVENVDLFNRGQKRQLGRVFEKNGKQCHVMYCPICRSDISYNRHDDGAISKFIAEGRWDFKKGRVAWCGKTSECRDWMAAHFDWLKSENENYMMNLKSKGLMA